MDRRKLALLEIFENAGPVVPNLEYFFVDRTCELLTL